jgi:hypothetical protein
MSVQHLRKQQYCPVVDGSGVEVILPPLLAFFLDPLSALKPACAKRIRRPDILWFLAGVGQKVVQAFLDEAEAICAATGIIPTTAPSRTSLRRPHRSST